MAKINAPCKGCADRFPACQSPEKCQKWAEYSELKSAEKESQIAAGDMHRDCNAVRFGTKGKRRRCPHVT